MTKRGYARCGRHSCDCDAAMSGSSARAVRDYVSQAIRPSSWIADGPRSRVIVGVIDRPVGAAAEQVRAVLP